MSGTFVDTSDEAERKYPDYDDYLQSTAEATHQIDKIRR